MSVKHCGGLVGAVILVAQIASAASIRNVYFSNGELVSGQRYRADAPAEAIA